MTAGATAEGLRKHLQAMWNTEGVSDFDEMLRLDQLSDITTAIFNDQMPTTWYHQPVKTILLGHRDCPSITDLGNVIDEYLATDFLRSPRLDWLLANVIMFSEINAASREIGMARYYDKDAKPNWWKIGLRLGWRAFCWSAWLIAAVVAYKWHPLAIGILSAWTAVAQFYKWRRKDRNADLLTSMVFAYDGLDHVEPSWRNVWGLLEDSRRKGAKWPTPLYRLVERNLQIAVPSDNI